MIDASTVATGIGLSSSAVIGSLLKIWAAGIDSKRQQAADDRKANIEEKAMLAGKLAELKQIENQANANRTIKSEKEWGMRFSESWRITLYKRVDDSNSMYNAVRSTRRLLALIIGTTLCLGFLIAILEPGLPLVTRNFGSDPKPIEVLFGFIRWTPSGNHTYVVTIGSLAYAMLYPLTTVLFYFFTPTGQRIDR